MSRVAFDAFLLTATPQTVRGRSMIALIAASVEGPIEALCSFEPYFFIDARVVPPPEVRYDMLHEEIFVSLSGISVRRITFTTIADLDTARRIFTTQGVLIFESDIRPRERFLMDHGIAGSFTIKGETKKRGSLLTIEHPEIAPSRNAVSLRLCSLDIETAVSTGETLSIALHCSGKGNETKAVLMRHSLSQDHPASQDHRASQDRSATVEYVTDERTLLERFVARFLEADPDIVIGWNVISFDLAHLLRRAKELSVRLPLGRGGRPLFVEDAVTRFARASLAGRVVLDGPQLLRTSFFSFESYSLENVARAVLGEGKLIGPEVDRGREIERLHRADPQALAAYNLKDAVLVTKIFEALKLTDLVVRRSQLSGMLLDQVGRSTASLDHLYLPRLHRYGAVAPDVGEVRRSGSGSGGYVLSPRAGIYSNIAALDFRSLYPSVIQTFHIDPLARARAGFEAVVTPKGFRFSREEAILPDLIEELLEARHEAKERKNAPLSQAIKILMNSFYGVMGSRGSRLFHPDLADAITSTGQWILTESKRRIEEHSHEVLYGDTDSLFVKLQPRFTGESFHEIAQNLARDVTAWWAERLLREYSVTSHLRLEHRQLYDKFLLPPARGGEGEGAKKRYAGLVSDQEGAGRVEFVGLEVVRSDWTALAREFQLELYGRIFRGEPYEEWVRQFVARLKKGEFDDKLVYQKRLHKPPDSYGKSPPPYVRAALLLKRPVRQIRYVMTTEGAVPVQLRPSLPHYQHYIDHQLQPVADSILELLGTSFEDLIGPQLSLF